MAKEKQLVAQAKRRAVFFFVSLLNASRQTGKHDLTTGRLLEKFAYSNLTQRLADLNLTIQLINHLVSNVRYMPDQLSQKFAALADPTRRAMLVRLTEGQASVSEIAEPFLDQMSLPAVTKHLKVLERAGLVTKTQDAQRRLCDLNPDGFKETVEFLEQYRQMWEASLDRLGAYLESVTAKDKQAKRKPPHGRKK